MGLLAEAARALRVSAGVAELRDVASEIEWAKVSQVRPDDYTGASAKAGRTPPLAADVVARLYASYEDLCRERHLVDFESVLELTAAILTEHAQAAAEVRDRYRYFVIDEYQDVNPLQKLLLDSWAGDRDDVCVVGDPADHLLVRRGDRLLPDRFTTEFPDATVVQLVRNYRSTPQVVALANQLTGAARPRPWPTSSGPGRCRQGAGRARHPGGSSAAALVAQRPAGPAVEFAEYADEEAEASSVAARVDALRAAGLPPGQVAVLVRTNAQTLALERALAERGVPCQVRGAERFFDRREVRQATGLLRAAAKSVSTQDGSDPPAEVRHILAGLGLTRDAPAGRGPPGSAGSPWRRWPSSRWTTSRPIPRPPWPGSSANWAAAAPSSTPPPSRASPWPRCTRPRGWSGTWSSCPASPRARCRSCTRRPTRRSRRSAGCSTWASPGPGSGSSCPGRWPGPRARGAPASRPGSSAASGARPRRSPGRRLTGTVPA